MDEETIRTKLTECFRSVFDEYEGALEDSVSASNVAQWDSLANIQFMVLVEQVFGVHFTTEEVTSLRNIGELVGLIREKLQS